MILNIVKTLIHKIKRRPRPMAETHPIGYQLAQAVTTEDELMKNNNDQGV